MPGYQVSSPVMPSTAAPSFRESVMDILGADLKFAHPLQHWHRRRFQGGDVDDVRATQPQLQDQFREIGLADLEGLVANKLETQSFAALLPVIGDIAGDRVRLRD